MKTYTISNIALRAFALVALFALAMSAGPVGAQVVLPDRVEVCEALEGTWASTVVDSEQESLNNGGPITDPLRSSPDAATGEEDWDNGGNTGFFSLGFNPETPGTGGFVTLSFDEYVLNVPGTDLVVYEATNGDTYPLEEVEVEVSQNGSDWEQIANADNTDVSGRTTELDFDSTGFDWIRYVRLTDVTDGSLHDETADAFDVDAVFAESAACDEPSEEGSITITKVYGVDTDWSFDFTGSGDLSFALTNAEPSETFVLEAGAYTFAEVLSDATDLLDITCSENAVVQTDLALGTVVVTLAADEEVSCTFTNRPAQDDGGGGDNDNDNDDLTCSLTTDDSSVSSGEEFTLTWETTNADHATIDNGIGDVALDGSTMTSIDDDTTFTLTASRSVGEDESDESVQCSVEVNRRSSGGGGGTRVDREPNDGGDSSSSDDDGPEGQVLGEQVSMMPLGAPSTGAGGTAPVASYAYFGVALFVRTRGEVRTR